MKNILLASRPVLRAVGVVLAFAVLLAVAQRARAQTYAILHAFSGAPDGANPESGLLRDQEGNLYGTTSGGGDYLCENSADDSCGTVFKVDSSGTESILYSFNLAHGTDPWGSLIQDEEGNLYGTTPVGGVFDQGTVFKLNPEGVETVLHNFSHGPGGFELLSRLALDSSGNLYGTTFQGGNSTNEGVVFKLNQFGKETVLYTFDQEFGQSSAGVLGDSDGTLYGTAFGGEATGYCQGYPCGVVYRVDNAGIGTIFFAFDGVDGMWPGYGDLIKDEAGNLYGATPYGGNVGCSEEGYGCGVVFKLDPAGNETVLYRFTGGMDGGFPSGGLARDPQGNLYGTTKVGGNVDLPACKNEVSGNGCGVVFKLDLSGHETTLYAFTGGSDGGGPTKDLIRDAAGNLYGTTVYGGDLNAYCPLSYQAGCGVVFKITP
ncbi:MAG: choice-of-anchor tandem repeat GloVer-containing protein [Terriglobales bacterium]